MTLTLVSSGDDRALAIRDHLVPLVRLSGSQEVQRDSVRLISLQHGPLEHHPLDALQRASQR